MANDSKPPKHRSFHTIFEWAVLGVFLMVVVAIWLLTERVISLETQSGRNSVDIERIAMIVQQLRDIWGK